MLDIPRHLESTKAILDLKEEEITDQDPPEEIIEDQEAAAKEDHVVAVVDQDLMRKDQKTTTTNTQIDPEETKTGQDPEREEDLIPETKDDNQLQIHQCIIPNLYVRFSSNSEINSNFR